MCQACGHGKTREPVSAVSFFAQAWSRSISEELDGTASNRWPFWHKHQKLSLIFKNVRILFIKELLVLSERACQGMRMHRVTFSLKSIQGGCMYPPPPVGAHAQKWTPFLKRKEVGGIAKANCAWGGKTWPEREISSCTESLTHWPGSASPSPAHRRPWERREAAGEVEEEGPGASRAARGFAKEATWEGSWQSAH